MTYDGAKTVAWAKTQVGFHEGHNNENPYSLWQYGNAFNPWCASFQCRAQYEGGYRFEGCTYGEKGEAYTPTEAQRAKQQGAWRERNWRAAPGDAVLFDWGNNGLIDHVEVVVYDDGVNLITIGGNTSDSVLYRKRDRRYVAGFWALSQSKQAIPPVDLAAIKQLTDWRDRVTAHPLRFGDRSDDVVILNYLLVAKGLAYNGGNAYGRQTRDGVVHLKKLNDLGTDGQHFGGPAANALLGL